MSRNRCFVRNSSIKNVKSRLLSVLVVTCKVCFVIMSNVPGKDEV